jgi:hypothetical protein
LLRGDAILAAVLLPEHTGFAVVCAVIGLLGGAIAAVHFSSDRELPGLKTVCRRAIVGFGLGLATGLYRLANNPMAEDKEIYLTLLYALGSGFFGIMTWLRLLPEPVRNALAILGKQPAKREPPASEGDTTS